MVIQKKKAKKLVLLKLESLIVVWWVILVSMLLTLILLLGCRIRSVKWRKCCRNLGCLCTNAKQKYGDRVMEERERVALLFWQAMGELRRLAPQKLCPPSLNRERLEPSLVAQRLKRLPLMQETWVWSLGQEDPLEKEMATHSSILAWRIPWTEKPGGLQFRGSQRVEHDWAT